MAPHALMECINNGRTFVLGIFRGDFHLPVTPFAGFARTARSEDMNGFVKYSRWLYSPVPSFLPRLLPFFECALGEGTWTMAGL